MTAAVLPPGVDFRRAFLINLASSTGGVATRFVLGLVLARLLQPAELGAYALALAIFSVAQLLRDLGVSAYLQREPSLTPEKFSACLGLLGASTAVVTLTLWLLAAPLARQWSQPGLEPLLHVLSLAVLVSPFGTVMAALQLRELAAGRIAYVSRLGALVHAGVALTLSLRGWGAEGLAWAQLANVLTCGAAYARLLPDGMRWRPSWRGWGSVLQFGAGAVSVGLLNGVNGVLPDLWLGHFGGARQVGLLGRAQSAVGLLQAVAGHALSFGALPVLADRHARGQSPGAALCRAAALLTGVGWPLLALTVIWREPLVRLLYGPAWNDCTPAVLPLALAAGVALVFAQHGAALTAIGRPALAVYPTALTLAARLALGAVSFDGSLASFAWALCAAAVVVLPLQLWQAARHLGAQPLLLLRALGGSAFVTLAVAAVPLPLAPLAWLTALRLSRHALLDELAQLLARRRMTSRK